MAGQSRKSDVRIGRRRSLNRRLGNPWLLWETHTHTIHTTHIHIYQSNRQARWENYEDLIKWPLCKARPNSHSPSDE